MSTPDLMPAGRYFVGDLCYVMHPEWDEFCSITISGPFVRDGQFALADGRRFASYRTLHGDGVYRASNGAELGVDAGLIGCIRVEDIRDPDAQTLEALNDLGTVVEFAKPFSTGVSRGVISFGHVTVDTNGDDDEAYEDCPPLGHQPLNNNPRYTHYNPRLPAVWAALKG